ncbi:MAG: ATP-binding protein, partial [Myxococcales bacterium]|nr:ATP-binding protein [Myxococcales bacterium]
MDYEKLGAFYLGRVHDLATGETTSETLLYDAKDLTTHAVIIGMTGSGKTGLGIDLLEEALIDGIPVIAIDPKGDLGNMLLAFPDLAPGDFRPWIDEAEAARKGRTADEHAKATAELWRDGLARWDQPPERIRRYVDACERAIYTPGSTAGRPIAVLRSLAAPGPAVMDDADALRERIGAAAASLLGLLGVDADPLRSREHILLSTLLQHAWTAGRDLDLPTLIAQIQSPPVQRVGVLELDSFYPPADRFELAMTLNNLLASPGFDAWTQGEPLDVARLLYGEGGRPRLSVLSLSHLSESERMFFVTLLLTEVVAWMRAQPGSSSLRAILYMDEVFGYFPPTANPPSKTPMLTLLKQARAYGLGCVLSTQNPVDLDYKGLGNTGTWFLGRLQAERDKQRVLEGLEGAAATASGGFDRARMERTLAGLGSRVFVMNNVHDDGPVVFETRWAMSYLAGPLARDQIKRLAGDGSGSDRSGETRPERAPAAAEASVASAARAPAASQQAEARPVL